MNPEHVRALEAVEPVATLKKNTRKSLLPSPPPDADATQAEQLAWVTVALCLGADPVARVERYGSTQMVLVTRAGVRVVFEPADDAFDPRRLERRVVLATGARMPHYGSADSATIAGAMVRASHLLAEDDDRDQAREWARTFLQEAGTNTIDVATVSTPEGRYEALTAICAWIATEEVIYSKAPFARAACILRAADTGARWVRTSHFGSHVRGDKAGARIGWSTLHARVMAVGWLHLGEVEQRQPGGKKKAKAHLYEVPAGWDQ